MQSTHNDSVVVNENSKYLKLNALNKELESLRNELKFSTLMKKTYVERNVVSSKHIIHKNIVNNDTFNRAINNEKRVKRIISNIEGDLKITVNSDDANIHVNNEVENNDFIQVAKKSKPTNGSRSITIVGNSTTKDCQAFKIKKRLTKNENIYVKSFPGATMEDMKDHVRSTVRHQADPIILHAGRNDLRNDKSANYIASDIMRLWLQMKTDINDVMISGITHRGDELIAKPMEVNKNVQAECERYNLFVIDNTNIVANTHLNGSGLHLNYKGTVKLANNFLSSIRLG